MVSKFNIGDIVHYENSLYQVVKIYAPNVSLETPFVYGLMLIQSNPREPYEGKLIVVREALLSTASDRTVTIWEVLYGKK
jgi:hypothetical protein